MSKGLCKRTQHVYVTESIFKMAKNKSNSDAFSRFPSSAFTSSAIIADERDNIAVSQRVLG